MESCSRCPTPLACGRKNYCERQTGRRALKYCVALTAVFMLVMFGAALLGDLYL